MRIRLAVCLPLLCLLIGLLSPVASAHSGRTDSRGGHYNRSTGEYHYHHGYPAHQHVNGICPYDFDDKTAHSSGSTGTGATNGYQGPPAIPPDSQNHLRDIPGLVLLVAFLVGPMLAVGLMLCGALLSFFTGKDLVEIAFHAPNWLLSGPYMLYLAAIPIYYALCGEFDWPFWLGSAFYLVAYLIALLVTGLRSLRLEQAQKAREQAEKRRVYLEQREHYLALYSGKSPLELAGLPFDTVIGDDGLPRQINSPGRWGARYTFYISSSGRCFHRYGCHGYIPVHAWHLTTGSRRWLSPCGRCRPVLPDLSWYRKYLDIQQIVKDYGIPTLQSPEPLQSIQGSNSNRES